MIDPYNLHRTDLLVRVASAQGRQPYWVVADGPDASAFVAIVVDRLRQGVDGFVAGEANPFTRRPKPGPNGALQGRGFDLRGARSESEVRRRVAEAFAPGAGANHCATWGDFDLRIVAGRESPGPDDTVQDAEHVRRLGIIRAAWEERETRTSERQASLEDVPDAPSEPGM